MSNDERLQVILNRVIMDMQVINMEQTSVDAIATEIETVRQSLDYWSELIRRFKSIQKTGKY